MSTKNIPGLRRHIAETLEWFSRSGFDPEVQLLVAPWNGLTSFSFSYLEQCPDDQVRLMEASGETLVADPLKIKNISFVYHPEGERSYCFDFNPQKAIALYSPQSFYVAPFEFVKFEKDNDLMMFDRDGKLPGDPFEYHCGFVLPERRSVAIDVSGPREFEVD